MSDKRLHQAPESRFDASSLVFDLPAEAASIRAAAWAQHGRRQKTLFKDGGRTVALFVLDTGTGLPEHKVAGTVTIQSVEGEIMVTDDGRPHRLGPHQVLVLAPSARHSVTADRPAALLLQVSLAAP